MALPTITVNLGELLGEDGEPQTLADNITSEAARLLVAQLANDVKEKVVEEVSAQVKEKITARIEEAFSGLLYETDSWGRRRDDKPFTLNELILKRVHSYLEERVNKDGRTDYGDKNFTRAQWVALTAAEDMVKKEIAPEIEKAKKEVKKAIGDKLSAAFKAALKESVACVC